jgi:hypothetical protein
MILKFPNLDTFCLALTNGAVPASVIQSRCTAGKDDKGQWWVETAATLTKAVQGDLRKLGVQLVKSMGAGSTEQANTWLEVLPLQPDPAGPERLEQTPVLFELASGAALAQLATEILRLGNDRQSFRWLEENGDGQAGVKSLLRVVGPPYYSLLRAIDKLGNKDEAPVAYIERAPRVWVELGQKHPLAEAIKPPAGKLLLLRPPRRWLLLEDAPFRDVYDVTEFEFPEAPLGWQDRPFEKKLKIPLSLKAGGSTDGAELWVLRDRPVEVLNHFVQNADDQLLNRLAFAVGRHGGQVTIAVRTRQLKLPPPVLVLHAAAYKPYLKLPNLFLPAGTRLHPPLRRDVVRKLLADDPSKVIWLAPSSDGEFTPQSLPETAFRPLWDWIDYVLDSQTQELEAWMQASRFEFEPFICDAEQQPKPRKAAGSDKPRGERRSGARAAETAPGQPLEFTEVAGVPDETKPDLEEELLEVIPIEKTELQQEQRLLEEKFLGLEGGLDTEERQELWPELARVNAALEDVEEAGICWMNSLWGQEAPSPEAAWKWFRIEASAVPPADGARPRGRSWVSRVLTSSGGTSRELAREELALLLGKEEPATADLRALAAYLVWAARRGQPPQALVDNLNAIQRFLETHERRLPVRATWLAWTHLALLSHGDVLALARARDRLLERLFQNGLRPEQDLASFLRSAGQPTSQRFRAVRKWLLDLASLAVTWVRKEMAAQPATTSAAPPMEGYVDLLFAYGLARLGELDASRMLQQHAATVLGKREDVHQLLLQAFDYRIRQAQEGKPHTGPLPPEQMEYLEHMERMSRYVVDRLRQHSQILEPDLKIDPFRHWGARVSDLDRELSELADLSDRKEVVGRVERLLKDAPKGAKGNESRARIVRAGLEVAPRISEDFARDMLDRVTALYDAMPEARDTPALEEQAKFLERAMVVAAHFDRIEHIHPLVSRFHKLLESQKGERGIKALESLAGQCFRGLRKLGMRDEIDHLLTQMADLVLQGQDVEAIDARQVPGWTSSLQALLHVAAGWYYFGRDRQADPIVKASRKALLQQELLIRDKCALASSYALTVGQGPVESATTRLEELFKQLSGTVDTYTTSRYYYLLQFDVLESAVRAVASDDFTLGSNARRWLDDDEYIVRRRIHRDLRHLIAQHS